MAIPIITTFNPLAENITFQKTPLSEKFYTSKLLNYTESVEIDGSLKTVFYTELNTNFNVGDRVFIVNGNYDSGDFILRDKYTKYTDGYRVLGCDGCRLILDLDFRNEKPFIEDSINKSIKVYSIRNQREFDYINSNKFNTESFSFDFSGIQNIQRGRYSKFFARVYLAPASAGNSLVLFSDSIVYIPSPFFGSNDPLNLNNGISSTNFNPGFYVRDDLNSIPEWINVTDQVLNNQILIINPIYNNVENILYIVDENFTLNSIEFKQRNTYTYDNLNWLIDLKYKVPYISRLNFRFGKFNGKHNDGIFGTNLRRNNWVGSLWNSGSFINSIWNSGIMNSKSTPGEKSFYATLNSENSSPVQTIDFSNNRGFGYNLIEDSNISAGEIKNGNFDNCNFGSGSTYSAVDVYFGLTHSFGLKLSGLFRRSDVDNVESEKAKFVNSRVFNSNLFNSELVNSQIYNSTSKNSVFDDGEGINVLASDIWAYNTNPTLTSTIRGILKLYISDSDSQKLLNTDSFYLTKINKNLFLSSLSGDQKIRLPIETKYILDIYQDYELTGEKIIVTIKNKNDNKIKSVVNEKNNQYGNTFSRNSQFNFASIDIESRAFAWYNARPTSQSLIGPISQQLVSTYIGGLLTQLQFASINKFFTGTYLGNADFKSGYFDDSTWKSGTNINYKHHVIPYFQNQLNVNAVSTDTLYIGLEKNPMNSQISILGEDLFVNDVVWLDSIDEIDGNNIKSINGRYRVIQIIDTTLTQFKQIYLRSLDGLTFSTSSSFEVRGAEKMNYASISNFRINNSIINSGMLVRSSIKSSTIQNRQFDNEDREQNIINIERLKLINILFKDSNNQINSGYIHKSHFINDTWNSGIIYNSIWNGGVFNSGVFSNAYWQNGNFKNGAFINSRDVDSTTQSYDNTPDLIKNWNDGTFDFGEFFNSIWFKGTFNNGQFYNSEWYSGTWSNGLLGSKSLRAEDTKMSFSQPITNRTSQNTVWLDGVVENAILGGSGSLYWYGGKFNNGEFNSLGDSNNNESIWYNGDFNNGKFSGLARWKNGKFFKGKFHSHLGFTFTSPTNPSNNRLFYAWEDGKFLGGEFGNASTGTNSTWFGGEFVGGIFQGRFWYNGLFTGGEFRGSGSGSSIYNSKKETAPWNQTSENIFALSFTNSYYGLWFDGVVSDNPKSVKTEERVFTQLVRKSEELQVENIVKLENILWMNGTFSHKGGSIQNSIWLKGKFYDGIFDSSIFNAYVDRTFTNGTPSFANTQSCIWYDGIFDSTLGTGSFYISDWETGTFNNGYMSGATWRNGFWNYGFADNIIWLDGLWRNGNWNGAPFDFTSVDRTQPGTYSLLDGRSEDILIHVAKNLGTSSIYVNNVFSASTAQQILTDPEITSLNTPTSSVSFSQETYQYTPLQNTTGVSNPSSQYSALALIPPVTLTASIWQYGTTFSIDSTSFVTNTHVFTSGGDDVPNTRLSAPSSRLFASLNNNTEVFSTAGKSYVITIKLTVEDNPELDVFIKVGDKPEVKLTLLSRGVTVGNRIVYFPRQYDLSFVYTTPLSFTTPPSPSPTKQFYVRKGNGGILRILYLDIQEREYQYHPEFNNSIFSGSVNLTTNSVSLPSGSEVEILGVSSDANLVSINFGNGLFKSGIWENGIWNNGFRSNEIIEEEDYYKFSNIVGLNGVFPYGGKGTYQISSTTWLVTLQSIESLVGLNIGDKVSIGNLVAIDINESRKLIKDYFTITQLDLINSTIVVELVSNFPIIRVERDSEYHLIYLTKNVWLTGAFLNGIFKGIWNHGLFKSYPYIGVMANAHWVDGKLDGGRFISRRNNSLGFEYNTGLIQNFIFLDNNATSISDTPKFNTWMDLVYETESYTTINRDSFLGSIQSYPTLQNGFSGFSYSTISEEVADVIDAQSSGTINTLQGSITYDVLESLSSFRLSDNTIFKYNLGMKYKVYQNFIPNNGDFLEPFSNNLGSGLNLNAFEDNGWIYKDFAIPFFASSSPTFSIITLSPLNIDSNVVPSDNSVNLKRRLRINTKPLLVSVVIQIWNIGTNIIQIRFNRFILNNENIVTEPNRYYITSVNLNRLNIYTASWASGSGNVSSSAKFNLVNGVNDYTLFNPSQNQNSLTKTQYFFNKKGLDLNIEVSTQLTTPYSSPATPSFPYLLPTIDNRIDVIFNNISFLEVDMIPFFNYYFREDEERIDNRIKTPWFAVAPFIDYSNANFDFLGNIDLSIDSELVNNQASYAIISAGGIGGSITTPSGGFPDGVIDFESSTNTISL